MTCGLLEVDLMRTSMMWSMVAQAMKVDPSLEADSVDETSDWS